MIVTARKTWHCKRCGTRILPGDRYVSMSAGERKSVPYCVGCGRSQKWVRDDDPTHTQVVLHLPIRLLEQVAAVAEDRDATIDEVIIQCITNQFDKRSKP